MSDFTCPICGMAHTLENMDFVWIVHDMMLNEYGKE